MKMKLEDILNTDGNIITLNNGEEYITFKGAGVSEDIDDDNLYANHYDHHFHHEYNSEKDIKKIVTCDRKTVLYDSSKFCIGDVIKIDNERYVVIEVNYEEGLYLIMNGLGSTKRISHNISAFLVKHATNEQIILINNYKRIIRNLLGE